jgi:hypothetical protein
MFDFGLSHREPFVGLVAYAADSAVTISEKTAFLPTLPEQSA